MQDDRGWVLFIALIVVVAVLFVAIPRINLDPQSPTANPPPPGHSPCPRAVGLCLESNVTHIVDGDTLDLESGRRVRLVLVDAPEIGQPGSQAAMDYLTSLCLGERALIDEDDNQIGDDPAGRILAVVHCVGVNANAAMISSGHALTYHAFCSVSEFGGQAWTGCSSAPPDRECDPAYPDVCIPSPPPDLDCRDISYRNFRVLSPDPHFFDGDGDGLGCEGA